MHPTHPRLFTASRVLFPAAAFGALLLPTGCMTGDDKKGDDVLAHYEQALKDHDPTAKTYTTKVTEWECLDGVVKETVEDVDFEYAIEGGKLYLWEAGECEATVLTGSGTELYGTWTMESPAEVVIPASARPEDCPDVLEEDPFGDDALYDGLKAVYEFSPSEISVNFEGELCMGRSMAEGAISEGIEDSSSLWEVVSSSCHEVSLRNKENDKTAKFSSTTSGGNVSVNFSYDGKTCSMKVPASVPGEAMDCSEDDANSEFFMCLLESGIYGDFNFEGLEKSVANSARAGRSLGRF